MDAVYEVTRWEFSFDESKVTRRGSTPNLSGEATKAFKHVHTLTSVPQMNRRQFDDHLELMRLTLEGVKWRLEEKYKSAGLKLRDDSLSVKVYNKAGVLLGKVTLTSVQRMR